MTVSTGKVIAKVSDLDFKFDVAFTTQDAKFFEGTGMNEGSEMAPAIDIDNLEMNIDTAKSDIKLEGFFLSGLGDLILQLFNDKIYKDIIDMTEKYVETTLVEEVNKELFDHGTHYEIGS